MAPRKKLKSQLAQIKSLGIDTTLLINEIAGAVIDHIPKDTPQFDLDGLESNIIGKIIPQIAVIGEGLKADIDSIRGNQVQGLEQTKTDLNNNIKAEIQQVKTELLQMKDAFLQQFSHQGGNGAAQVEDVVNDPTTEVLPSQTQPMRPPAAGGGLMQFAPEIIKLLTSSQDKGSMLKALSEEVQGLSVLFNAIDGIRGNSGPSPTDQFKANQEIFMQGVKTGAQGKSVPKVSASPSPGQEGESAKLQRGRNPSGLSKTEVSKRLFKK